METPTIKCPRSGRLLTPLSLDYWRLKKLNTLLSSDSEHSGDEANSINSKSKGGTVLDDCHSVPCRLSGYDSDELMTPLSSRINKIKQKNVTQPSAKKTGAPRGNSPRAPRYISSSSDSDESLVIIRNRRTPRKIQSSDTEESDTESGTTELPSAKRVAEIDDILSKKLENTSLNNAQHTVKSFRSPSEKENRAKFILSSSDDESLLSLSERLKKKQFTPKNVLQNRKILPKTEPTKSKTKDSAEFVRPTNPVRKPLKDDRNVISVQKKGTVQKKDQDDHDDSFETFEDEKRFLRSLGDDFPLENCHRDALRFVKPKFAKIKEELTQKLFDIYHRSVFQNRFVDEIPVTWNIRMTKTAGFCYYKRHASGEKMARIELSPKVVDRTSRLRDTLVHEMCHAAAWIIHGYADGHGSLFRFWGQRAKSLLDLTVTTSHTYQIETKYIYRCNGCANEVRRHSKSLDLSRFVCSLCKSKFTCYLNDGRQPKQTEAKRTPYTEFLTRQLPAIKAGSPHLSHKDHMALLAKKWEQCKS